MGLPARLAGVKARLFGRGDPNAAPQRAGGNVTYLSTLDPGSAQRLRNYQSYLGAITIPDVYKCASVIANTFAATTLRVLDADDEEVSLRERLPELDALMRKPNPEMRGRQFRQTLSHHYQLTGNAIVLKDNYDGLGRPTELWPLLPSRVHILRSTEVGKLAYGYDVTEGAKTRTLWFDGADVLHTRWAHPSDYLFGIGVVEAGEQAFSRSRLVNEFTVNFFNRGAIVDSILQSPNPINEDERRALISDWKAFRHGQRNHLLTAVLSDGLTYTPIQEPLGSVPVMDLNKMTLQDIAQLFGVPLQLLGNFEDSNYRNAQESVQFFYGETLGPMLAQFEEDFWNPLLEDFDPSLRAEYEQREVIDYQMRADAAAKLAGTGAFSVSDLRVAAGYDPLPEDDELGALIPLPKGMTLLSPAQALALGEEVQEAPEELPAAPQVTELGQAAGAPPAAAQGQAQGTGQAPAKAKEGQQAASPEAAQPATEAPATAQKSVPTVIGLRGQKTYPAALLSPQVRQRQRRAQVQESGAPRRVTEGSVEGEGEGQPVLRLLSGTKEKEQEGADAPSLDAASAPALSGARAAPSPPRHAGAAAPANTPERSGPSAGTVAVSARPQRSDLTRIKEAYLAWSAQDDDADWAAIDDAAGLEQRERGSSDN